VVHLQLLIRFSGFLEIDQHGEQHHHQGKQREQEHAGYHAKEDRSCFDEGIRKVNLRCDADACRSEDVGHAAFAVLVQVNKSCQLDCAGHEIRLHGFGSLFVLPAGTEHGLGCSHGRQLQHIHKDEKQPCRKQDCK